MGTNSKASHAVYAIAPTAGGVVPAEAVDAPAEEYLQHLIGVIAHEEKAETDAEEALEKLAVLAVGGGDPADPEGPPALDFASTADHYDAVAAAAEEVIAAAGALDPEQANVLQQKAHELCRQFLLGLEHEDLLDLAGKNGFQYPELASLDGTAPSPLAFWLDPATAADDEQKKIIQAIALDRHALLIAGGSVGGKTVGDWYPAAAETPADTTFAAHLAVVAQHQQQGGAALASSIAALIDEENKFVAAHASPELIEAYRSQVDAALTAVSWEQLEPAIAQAQASGSLDDTATRVLGPHQVLKLLRTSTPSVEHTDLTALATARADQLKSASALAEELKGLAAGQPPALGESGGEQAALELLAKTRDLNHLVSEMGAWNSLAPAPDHQSTLKPCHAALAGWLKEQKLTELREFLTHNGILDSAAKMPRSKLLLAVQQHIATDKTMAGALATTIKGQNKPTASPTAKPTSFVYMAANPKSAFGHQHAQMVAALRAAQSAQTATPQPVDAAAVESWDFGAGKPAALGGTHPKTVHTGPDGRTWLAKREGTPRGGAVTHAEAAASRMLARAGLPCVPVYASKIGGTPVSLQPMLTGAKEMSTQPGSWTQADVDSLVRLHVANWALGNHDGHSGNVLRTNDGGLVPIDLGQAFKNFGRDKLSLDYRPYTNPLHHMAYDAHLKGGLAKGVRIDPSVAHPVIRSIESIPDVEWRAMMHEAAHRGASQPMKWSQPMRARAAKKHGVPESAVTKDQIAEALLDTAVERKNNLRKDFAQFFTKELQLSSASALQYLGKS